LPPDIGPERFDGPAPTKVVTKILGGDTVEWTQPFLQTAMVAVDVVEMEIRRFRSRATGCRQNTAGDLGLAGEADDRLATIAAELVVRRDHTTERGGD